MTWIKRIVITLLILWTIFGLPHRVMDNSWESNGFIVHTFVSNLEMQTYEGSRIPITSITINVLGITNTFTLGDDDG